MSAMLLSQVYPGLNPERIRKILSEGGFHALIEIGFCKPPLNYHGLITTVLNKHLSEAFIQRGELPPSEGELDAALSVCKGEVVLQ